MPYLLALATASKIGSAATVTGNPQNILIGSLSGISFVRFVSALGPVAFIGLLLDAAFIWMLFRPDLQNRMPGARVIKRTRIHRALLLKTLAVTAGVLAGFLAGYSTALVAAAGAAFLLITRRIRPPQGLSGDRLGLADAFRGPVCRRRDWGASWVRSVDVRLLAPVGRGDSRWPERDGSYRVECVPRLPDPDRAWLALAMSSTFAGNFTVLGSIANLIVVEGARRRGVTLGFSDYARLGVPLSFATILIGVFWLANN